MRHLKIVLGIVLISPMIVFPVLVAIFRFGVLGLFISLGTWAVVGACLCGIGLVLDNINIGIFK